MLADHQSIELVDSHGPSGVTKSSSVLVLLVGRVESLSLPNFISEDMRTLVNIQ